MNRDVITHRWRATAGWLLRSTGQPPRLTPWGWAADVILALVLAIGAVGGALQPRDVPIDPFSASLYPGEPNPVPAPRFLPPVPPAPAVPSVPAVPVEPSGPDLASPVTWWLLVLAALSALPLATRRRFPLTSFWIIAFAVAQLYQAYDQLSGANATWTVVAALVAAYSAITYSRYRNLALASVVIAAAWVTAGIGEDMPSLPSGLLLFLLLASAGLGANSIHARRQRAQTLQREQEVATQLAVDRERARLARELHDVVGHNVSVMVVQAGAARKVMDTAPDLAREALHAVEAGGRAAMNELRQVIGLLTVDNDGTDLAPPPGLDQLPQLAGRIRETGVPVTLTVTGTFASLPTGVDLAAYRVVQEALTNAVKHAAGAAVAINVTGTGEELRVEVTDTGGSASAATPGSGRGLAGLRERLSVYGGTLTVGRRPTGGYRLVAVIPLGGNR